MKTLILAMSIGLLAETAFSLDLKPSEIRGKTQTPTQPVTVLQNRFFLKTHRPELGLMVGSMLNEAYTDTVYWGARLGMFANEWVGLEFQYLRTRVGDSDDRKALNKKQYRSLSDANVIVKPDPEVNAIHKMLDFNLVTAPFYGKLNFVDELIVYTDLFISTGYSRVTTDQGDKSAFSVAGGLRFYMLESLSLRAEFKDRIFNETRAGQNNRRNALSTDVGLSYFFL